MCIHIFAPPHLCTCTSNTEFHYSNTEKFLDRLMCRYTKSFLLLTEIYIVIKIKWNCIAFFLAYHEIRVRNKTKQSHDYQAQWWGAEKFIAEQELEFYFAFSSVHTYKCANIEN